MGKKNKKYLITLEIFVKSPGRVNLIGEHTDYNGGNVLPCAINLSLELRFKSSENKSFISTDLGNSFQFDVNQNFKKSKLHWENYIYGVVNELKRLKKKLLNFECNIFSTLPAGAGISSSSALVCGLIKGLSELNNLKLDNSKIISISRIVEHKYIGVLGGIMDQFTILNAKKNMAILLNCDNLKFKYVDLNFNQYELLLIDTKVKHNLSNSEYNNRVFECKKSLEIINKECGENFSSLSQISKEDLEKSKVKLKNKFYKRASYVFNENQRTIKSAELLKKNKLVEFGKLMYESHDGLRKDYEVSCKELDFLVDKTKKYDEILGSRMMGGGFGGCTINLIKRTFINKFIKLIKEEYFSKFGLYINPIIAKPGTGMQVQIF